METSLHRELKKLYAGDGAATEVTLGGYRIDALRDEVLIEVQHGSLSAIRDKIARLLKKHQVLVVKPLVVRKHLVQQAELEGPVTGRRLSPKRGAMVDLFHELIYFTRVFPHPRLTLEVVEVEIEEWRVPGHGRRRRWRRKDHIVSDQRLLSVGEKLQLVTAGDLLKLLPAALPREFHSGQVAELLGVKRWVAQRIVYCLREMGGAIEIGKQGNTRCYRLVSRRRRRPAA